MKKSIFYWTVLAVLGTVHLQALNNHFSLEIPIYLTCLLTTGAACFFYKRMVVNLSILGTKSNFILFGLQLLLLFFYSIKRSWVLFIPVILFIALEMVRLTFSRKLASLSQEVNQYKEQTIHINETFRAVRNERHDFLKHVSTIHFMLEKGQSTEAKAYLDHLVDGYEETNLSIKGERGAAAGVLHQMYRQAKEKGINVHYDFDLPLSSLPLSDKHMVTLIGNLLSNSIDACQEWQNQYGEQASITLEFYKRSGLYLLTCKNNSLPIPNEILDGLFVTYGNTTKSSGHEGLGTKIIKDLIAEYQGFLDFVYKEEEFTVKIKIPAIQ